VATADGFAQAFEQAFKLGHPLAQLCLPAVKGSDPITHTVEPLVDLSFQAVNPTVEAAKTRENDAG
jgi:hypothetical protein